MIMLLGFNALGYNAIGGVVFDLGRTIKVKPSFMLKYKEGLPVATDLSINFLLNHRLWVGLTSRINDAVGMVFDTRITKSLRIGYSYEYILSDIASISSGNHELIAIYEMDFRIRNVRTPRYF